MAAAGQFSWPPAGSYLAVFGHFLVAADKADSMTISVKGFPRCGEVPMTRHRDDRTTCDRTIAMSRDVAAATSADGDSSAGADFIDQSQWSVGWFAEIYERHSPAIYQYVAGRLGRDIADDLAAETFVIAFRQRHTFDDALGAVRPWLFGIATNLVAQHRRAEARRYRAMTLAGAQLVSVDHEDQIAARLSAQQLREPLARALSELPDGDRDVLLLVAIAGLTYPEVADVLSIPEGTVASRLSRARRKISSALRSHVRPVRTE